MAISTVSPQTAPVRSASIKGAAQSSSPSTQSAKQPLSPTWSSPAKDGFSAAAASSSPAPASAPMIDRMRAAAAGGQGLSKDQKAVLQSVFGKGLDADKIKVTTGSQELFKALPRETPAFTVGNTIVVNPNYKLDNNMLVHESAHVWQFQNGGIDYLPKALAGQWLGQGYDWQKGLSSGRSFSTLNPEQQAQMIQDAYGSGYFNSGSFKVGNTDYTTTMDAAMKDVRAGKGVSTTWDTGK